MVIELKSKYSFHTEWFYFFNLKNGNVNILIYPIYMVVKWAIEKQTMIYYELRKMTENGLLWQVLDKENFKSNWLQLVRWNKNSKTNLIQTAWCQFVQNCLNAMNVFAKPKSLYFHCWNFGQITHQATSCLPEILYSKERIVPITNILIWSYKPPKLNIRWYFIIRSKISVMNYWQIRRDSKSMMLSHLAAQGCFIGLSVSIGNGNLTSGYAIWYIVCIYQASV